MVLHCMVSHYTITYYDTLRVFAALRMDTSRVCACNVIVIIIIIIIITITITIIIIIIIIIAKYY